MLYIDSEIDTMRYLLLIWACAWRLGQCSPETEVGITYEVRSEPIIEVMLEKMGLVTVRGSFIMRKVKESIQVLKSISTSYKGSALFGDANFKTKYEDKLVEAENALEAMLETYTAIDQALSSSLPNPVFPSLNCTLELIVTDKTIVKLAQLLKEHWERIALLIPTEAEYKEEGRATQFLGFVESYNSDILGINQELQENYTIFSKLVENVWPEGWEAESCLLTHRFQDDKIRISCTPGSRKLSCWAKVETEKVTTTNVMELLPINYDTCQLYLKENTFLGTKPGGRKIHLYECPYPAEEGFARFCHAAELNSKCGLALVVRDFTSVIANCRFTYHTPLPATRLIDGGVLVQDPKADTLIKGEKQSLAAPFIVYKNAPILVKTDLENTIEFPEDFSFEKEKILNSSLTIMHRTLLASKCFTDSLWYGFLEKFDLPDIMGACAFICCFLGGMLTIGTCCLKCVGKFKKRVPKPSKKELRRQRTNDNQAFLDRHRLGKVARTRSHSK